MASPLATEKIVRAILRSLVHGGFYASALGEETLSALPVNASDADIDTAVNSFTYNTAAITGVSVTDLISNTDLTLWTDADSLPPGLHNNWFRVASQGETAGDVNKTNEWFTIRRANNHSTAVQPLYAALGPQTTLLSNTAEDIAGYTAVLGIGSYWSSTLGSAQYYGLLTGGFNALAVDHGYDLHGFRLTSKENVEIGADKYINFTHSATGVEHGGFYSLDTTSAAFFVGEYPETVSDDSLLFSQVAGTHHFQIKLNNNLTDGIIFVNSNCTTSYSVGLGVGAVKGAVPGTSGVILDERDPGNHGYPQLSVFGTNIGNDTVALFKATQAGCGGGAYTGNIIKAIHNQIANPGFNFLWFGNYTGPGIDQYTGVFRVNGGGVAYGSAFTTPYSDLAEWMLTDAPHDPGSVLVMRDGIAVLSDAYEATGVVGVVSSQPGLVMNGMCESKENHVRVAKSGMVPVFFSTEFGDVDGNGELLCAGPGGYAVRAPEIPKPGSIVGKAMSAMSSYHGDDVCGVIQMLVC